MRKRLCADSSELAISVELHVHELLAVNERLVWYLGDLGGNIYLRESRVGETGAPERSCFLAEHGAAQSSDVAERIEANCLNGFRKRNFYQPVGFALDRFHRSAELPARYHSA